MVTYNMETDGQYCMEISFVPSECSQLGMSLTMAGFSDGECVSLTSDCPDHYNNAVEQYEQMYGQVCSNGADSITVLMKCPEQPGNFLQISLNWG